MPGRRDWRRARFAVRAGRENLDDQHRQILSLLRRHRYRLRRTWELEEQLRDLYRTTDPADARAYLKRWCTAAKRSRIPAFRNLVRRIEKHADAIVAAVGLGLDQHQHRRWRAWHRWTTSVIAAHAFLAAAVTVCVTSPDDVVTFTINELRKLFHASVLDPARRTADIIAWSIFRRRHQGAAKISHYARQALTEP